MKILEIKNLSYSYENQRDSKREKVLKNLNFSVEKGSNVGLIGANGAGKSTLLKLLTGLLTASEGEIIIDGMALSNDHLKELRKKIGYVFQDSDSQLFMSTVYEDVAFGPRNYGESEEMVRKSVMEALRKVHMEEKKDRQIHRLSGGEKKLASIATVLAMQEKLLLLDEPSVTLDPRNRRNLIQIIRNLPGTKIIAGHDLDFIYDTCDRILLISEGRLAADGGKDEILKNQELLEANGLELPLAFSRKN